MFKILLEIASMAPGTVAIVKETIANFEAATDTETKIAAIVGGLESLAAEIKNALTG